VTRQGRHTCTAVIFLFYMDIEIAIYFPAANALRQMKSSLKLLPFGIVGRTVADSFVISRI